jgi:hypothetical protein
MQLKSGSSRKSSSSSNWNSGSRSSWNSSSSKKQWLRTEE